MTATLAGPPETAEKALPYNGFGIAMGVITACIGAIGGWAGLVGMFGAPRPVHIGWLLPLSGR